MYFEPLISVKCCPKLHIKQLRTIYITFVCEIGLGWRGGSQMKRGVQEKGGSGPPDPPPPSGHAYAANLSGFSVNNANKDGYNFFIKIEFSFKLTC